MDRTILVTHRRVRRSTAGPKRPDVDIWDATNAGSYKWRRKTTNHQDGGWVVGCVRRFSPPLSLSLSFIEMFTFSSSTIIVVIVILYRFFLRLSHRNYSSFGTRRYAWYLWHCAILLDGAAGLETAINHPSPVTHYPSRDPDTANQWRSVVLKKIYSWGSIVSLSCVHDYPRLPRCLYGAGSTPDSNQPLYWYR